MKLGRRRRRRRRRRKRRRRRSREWQMGGLDDETSRESADGVDGGVKRRLFCVREVVRCIVRVCD